MPTPFHFSIGEGDFSSKSFPHKGQKASPLWGRLSYTEGKGAAPPSGKSSPAKLILSQELFQNDSGHAETFLTRITMRIIPQ
jgi:hypothetical protein